MSVMLRPAEFDVLNESSWNFRGFVRGTRKEQPRLAGSREIHCEKFFVTILSQTSLSFLRLLIMFHKKINPAATMVRNCRV